MAGLIHNPTAPNTAGTFSPSPLRDSNYGVDDGFLFARGFDKPSVDQVIAFLEPQYFATSLLTRLEGRSIPSFQETYNWPEQDRTAPKAFVASVAGGLGTLTISITTSGGSEKGFVPGNRVLIPSSVNPATGAPRNALIGIVATVGSGTMTLTKQDQTIWFAATPELSNSGGNSSFGLMATLMTEGSSSPNPTPFSYPDVLNNNLAILRDKFTVTGTALTNRSYFGKTGNYYYDGKYIKLKEFQKQREIFLNFGQRSDGTTPSTEGFLDSILARGTTRNYTAPMIEADVQNLLDTMAYRAPVMEYLFLCGRDWLSQWHKANKDYALAAGARGIAGETNDLTLSGLEFTSYKFNGVTIHLAMNTLFNDDHVLTNTGNTGLNAYRNWRGSAMAINMGMVDGQPAWAMRHKEENGINRSFTYDELVGVGFGGATSVDAAGNSTVAASSNRGAVTDVDGIDVHLLSHIGAQMKCAHWNGLMHRNA